MTSQEALKLFQVKLNKNDTNKGISVPNGVFVLLFNVIKDVWLGEEIKKDEDNIDINVIQQLFISDFPLDPINGGVVVTGKKYIQYETPDDFFQAYGFYSKASRGKCETTIYNYEKKPGDILPVLQDYDNRPSFDYEEAPYIISQNNIKLYFDDYEVKESYFNYYRFVKPIDIEGYDHEDGTPSKNIDPELNDYNVNRIIDRLVLEIMREDSDIEGVQAAKDRLQQEF